MNQQNNQFDAHVNVNLNNQYWLQVYNNQRLHVGQRKPVGVFWDIENCSVPRNVNAGLLVEKIRALFTPFNFIENEFVVVCDVFGINHNVITELNNMQVNIIHVHSFSKNACDEKLKQLIIRFVSTHGQNCAIILFSSDINFAPVLTDIKNRVGVFVILFHHHQVSPALIASSNYHFDYDTFCSIPHNQYNYMNHHEDFEQTMTTLMISNFPKLNDEGQARMFLNRITNNVGGRITNVDMENCEATVSFKCRSDALRCHQRINNRKFYGNFLLKSRIETKINQNKNYISNNRYYQIGQESNDVKESSQNGLVQLKTNPNSSQVHITDGKIISSPIQEANICMKCMIEKRKRSIHSNFLLQNQIFNIHISLENLSKKLIHLLAIHDGKLPFNALPDCWLNNFEEEFDTTTEPKVMLEHLISCVPNVAIRDIELYIDNQKIKAKSIIYSRESSSKNDSSSFKKKRMKRLKKIMNNIHLLLISKIPSELTGFPSIKFQDIESEYRNHFVEDLNYEKHGCLNLLEMLSLFESKFNIYTYENDYLLALNFNEQLNLFISNLNNLFLFDQSSISQKFSEFFQNLNPVTYGVCHIEDMINALINLKPNSLSTSNDLKFLKKIIIENYSVTQNSSVVAEFKKIIPQLKEMLSLSDFSVELKKFHGSFESMLKKKLNIEKLSCLQTANLILKHGENNFEIFPSENDSDLLIVDTEYQFIQVGQQFVKIFGELAILLFKNFDEPNEYNLVISIYEILYYYQRRYRPFNLERFGTKSFSKLFEKILAYFFKSKIHLDYCLIYVSSNIYLLKFVYSWKQEIIRHLFMFVFQNLSKTLINFKTVKQYFQDRFGFSFGISLLCDSDIQEMFQVSKNQMNELTIKFHSFYEFASMCLAVMLLHEKIVCPQTRSSNGEKFAWTLDQIENEFYDHFGISMYYSNQCQKCDISLFSVLDWLFEIDFFHTEKTIRIKQGVWFHRINFDNIPCCNYCEITKSQSDQTFKDFFR